MEINTTTTYFVELTKSKKDRCEVIAYVRTTDEAWAQKLFDRYVNDVRKDCSNGADGVRMCRGYYYDNAEIVESYGRWVR